MIARRLLPAGALLLAACGASTESDPDTAIPLQPVPGCESIDPTPCDTQKSECQRRLLTLAACMRGDAPGELPPVTVMTQPEYTLYLQNKLAEQEPAPVPNHYEVALTQLQLSVPGGLSGDAWIAQQVEFIWGFYRLDSKDIVLIDHGASFDARQASSVLLHEFIHTLQDRSVDLQTLEREQGTSYDNFLAVDAMIEGEARFFQDRYGASILGLDPKSVDWPLHYQNSAERETASLFSRTSHYSESYDVFPYSWGARYVNIARQSGEAARLLPQYENPPTQTRSVMASTTSVVDDVVTRELAALEPSAEWAEVDCGTLGAWGTFLTFAPLTSSEAGQALALDWRGDSFCVYANGDETLLSWRLDLDNEASAAALSVPAAQLVATTGVRQSGTRLTLVWASHGTRPEWAFGP